MSKNNSNLLRCEMVNLMYNPKPHAYKVSGRYPNRREVFYKIIRKELRMMRKAANAVKKLEDANKDMYVEGYSFKRTRSGIKVDIFCKKVDCLHNIDVKIGVSGGDDE